MSKDKRKKQIKLRKNFFPTLIITILLWAALGFIIYFVDPFAPGAVILFLTCSFLALLFTFSIIFAHTRRGFIAALGLTFFLILRYFAIGNILNFLLIGGVCLAFEYYFSRR